METSSDSAVLGDWGIDKLWTFEVKGSKWPKRQYHTLKILFYLSIPLIKVEQFFMADNNVTTEQPDGNCNIAQKKLTQERLPKPVPY